MLHLKINYSINQANFMTAGDHTHTHTHTHTEFSEDTKVTRVQYEATAV